MRNKRIAFILLAALFVLPLEAAIKKPVKVAGGLLSGVPGKDPSVAVFKGIPYAAPPIGDLRWRNPQPAKAWSGVRKADTFGPSCAQSAPQSFGPYTSEFLIAPEPISEDCLALNVWTAAKSSSERRPVYVFIHGGGFGSGSGAIPIYDGEGLAKKGIVVVTINYRVSMFGFLAHPELTKESPFKASGNYGTLDLIAALRWVQENIKAFGGDPTRVTIGGQSAGAMAVHDLIASPLAKGLFHGAIIESGESTLGGSGISISTPSLAEGEEYGLKFAQSKGAHSLAELRALSWQKLVEPVQDSQAATRASGMPATLRFMPIIDGYFLTALEEKVMAQGKQNDVVILTGYNSGEIAGSILGPQEPPTAESYAKEARQRYGDMADEFLQLYPATTDEEARIAKAQSQRDQTLASMYLWAKLRARTSKTKAFLYLWDHTLPGPDSQKWGAFHTAEIPYVMNTLSHMPDRPFTEVDRKIADMMSSYWANFIATADPNGKGLPSWPAVGEKPEVMEVGDLNQPVSVSGSSAKFAFFEKFLVQSIKNK